MIWTLENNFAICKILSVRILPRCFTYVENANFKSWNSISNQASLLVSDT